VQLSPSCPQEGANTRFHGTSSPSERRNPCFLRRAEAESRHLAGPMALLSKLDYHSDVPGTRSEMVIPLLEGSLPLPHASGPCYDRPRWPRP